MNANKKLKLLLVIILPVYVLGYCSSGVRQEQNIGAMLGLISSLEKKECSAAFAGKDSIYVKPNNSGAFRFSTLPEIHVDMKVLSDATCFQALMRSLTKREDGFNIIVHDGATSTRFFRISN